MEMNKEDGGPAFPDPQEDWRGEKGMTLRDYFAAKAMQAALANASLPGLHDRSNVEALAAVDQMATACYMIADAMLAMRTAG